MLSSMINFGHCTLNDYTIQQYCWKNDQSFHSSICGIYFRAGVVPLIREIPHDATSGNRNYSYSMLSQLSLANI